MDIVCFLMKPTLISSFSGPDFFHKAQHPESEKRFRLLCIFIYLILPKAIQKGGLKMKHH